LDYQRASAVFFSEPFYDLTHKWGLFEGGVLRSCLTTTPLLFGHGAAIGVAGVATASESRNQGFAKRIISDVSRATNLPTMLFAKDARLYEALGFECVDSIVRAPLVHTSDLGDALQLDSATIQPIYQQWSQQSPDRLQRDERRWRFWNWHYRVCYGVGDRGYVATEPGVLREAILTSPLKEIPVSPDTEWLGTERLMNELELPTTGSHFEMHVMTKGFDFKPSLFLTDQF
jgi:hypothetical protein